MWFVLCKYWRCVERYIGGAPYVGISSETDRNGEQNVEERDASFYYIMLVDNISSLILWLYD